MFAIQDSTFIYGIPPIQGPICDENLNKWLCDCTNYIVVMMMHGNIVIDLLKFHLYLYKLMHHPRALSHVLKITVAQGSINVIQQLVTNELFHFFFYNRLNQTNHVNIYARQQNNYVISYIDPLIVHMKVSNQQNDKSFDSKLHQWSTFISIPLLLECYCDWLDGAKHHMLKYVKQS